MYKVFEYFCYRYEDTRKRKQNFTKGKEKREERLFTATIHLFKNL